MAISDFGRLSASFGLIKCPCKIAADEFLLWQQVILKEWGFAIKAQALEGGAVDVVRALSPRTAPISTRYVFWTLNEKWTLYFDNGANGTDAASPMSVLSSRLKVDSLRITMADEVKNPDSGQVMQYRASIFECYSEGVDRRHVFSANDGGKWKFGESGDPFEFEDVAAYKLKSIKDRLTNAMILSYLKRLDADFDAIGGHGYLLTKSGKMPPSYKEFKD
ncbi:hypothetical protein FNU76_05745 [Chitinimonas arctica]|uniref:Uncharacterized protein n=1 Tax=Chitinimonas arctica TaxID=2594795 RepID=A0A516SCL4_9NEIS|nr:hypothetical protein [Chitinimonas arctica]QDQ25893.1 hypothetical protein FNU76_05745 [Chitinimonas arctica]